MTTIRKPSWNGFRKKRRRIAIWSRGYFTDHDHKEADVIKKLCVEDQRLMQDLYHSHQRAQDVADKHDYTIKRMYKHINSVIDKLCQ